MRRRSIVLAAMLSPVFVVTTAGVGSSVASRDAVTTSQRTTRLLPAASPAVGNGDVVTPNETALARTQAAEQGLPATDPVVLQVTPEQPVDRDLVVVGVTWQRGSGGSVVVQYRVRADGGWQPWRGVDIQADSDSTTAGGRSGSDPIVVTGARRIQARVLGQRSDTPVAAELSVIDPGVDAADAAAGQTASGAATAAPAAPRIYSRLEWGADESIRQGSTPSYGVVRAAVVHHTAGTNSYRADQVPAILRGIYAFHVKSRGWSDIGYNLLVDKWGRVWEGRAGGVDRAVIGAHTLGHNASTMGISVMGDYGATAAPAAAVAATARVIGWKASVHGFSPTGRTVIADRSLPTVMGHRDANATSCPGAFLYAALPSIRAQASAVLAPPRPAPPPSKPAAPRLVARPQVRDLDRVGASSVLARTAAGQLLALRALPSGSLTAPRYVGRGWGGIDAIALGDWDGDLDIDVLARVRTTGDLRIYPSTGAGALGSSRLVSRGWSARMLITSTGDITGDGRPDILSVTKSGHLILNAGARGSLRAPAVVGRGWAGMRHLVGVGDWTRDGKPDLLAVSSTGVARLYPGLGRARWGRPSVVGTGWSRYVALVGVVNGPGRSAVLGTDRVGRVAWGSAGVANRVVWRTLSTSLKGLMVYSG